VGEGEEDDDGEQIPVPHTFIFTKRSSFLPDFEMNFVSLLVGGLGIVCPSRACILKIELENQGLPRDLAVSERCPRSWRAPDDATARDDLFCLVKSEMSSSEMSQLPLLVWPSTLMQQSKRFLEVANSTGKVQRPKFDDPRKQEIYRLACAIRKDFPHMYRAAAWYESLLERNPNDCPEPYTTLRFLQNVPDEGPCVHDFSFGARRAPPTPHSLEVVFHRRS